MRIDLKAKRVELSAQEFATFRPGPGAGAGGAPWRAEAGRQWHETMRKVAEAEGQGWQFERAIACRGRRPRLDDRHHRPRRTSGGRRRPR
jgi:hypothetical protein